MFPAQLFAKLLGRYQPALGSVYELKLRSLEGNMIDFAGFRGKPMLIVNTASRCAYTPQYAELQQLHETLGHLVTVLAFPSNNFLWQEPGTNRDIGEFCQRNYGVTFPVFEKMSVKGWGRHPLYQWLYEKTGKLPTWNFCKYLVDASGNKVTFYGKKVSPLDGEITRQIQ